jgi:hypothetical protein
MQRSLFSNERLFLRITGKEKNNRATLSPYLGYRKAAFQGRTAIKECRAATEPQSR